MTINERIRYIRKELLHITQEALGEPLGLTRANIANIEAERIAVTERVIISLCREFNVNEEWLREEIGDPLIPKSRNQIITDFAGDLIKEENESFKKRLIEALAELEPDEWELLEKIALELTSKKD